MNLPARPSVYCVVSDQTEQVYNEWLVLRCQGGDREAIGALVEHWQPHLIRFAQVVVRDADLAQEATQETWISTIAGLSRLRDPRTFKTWLFRIAHNKCRDLLRKRAPELPAESEPTGRIHLNALENREQIEQTLAMLSEDHRAVLALHYLHDMELAEIAQSLDVPLGTVKSRLHHARESFRRTLDEEEQHGSTGRQDQKSAVANG